jgi:hypothetical protein
MQHGALGWGAQEGMARFRQQDDLRRGQLLPQQLAGSRCSASVPGVNYLGGCAYLIVAEHSA